MPLQAPLNTLIPALGQIPSVPEAVRVELEVGPDAPADLGIGAYVTDDDGVWYQGLHPHRLSPGRHSLTIAINATMHAEPGRGILLPPQQQLTAHAGVFLWSASSSTAVIRVQKLEVAGSPIRPPAGSGPGKLHALEWHGVTWDGGSPQIAAGQRMELDCEPDPFPLGIYDQDRFSLRLVVTAPSGAQREISGYFHQPISLHDKGDFEASQVADSGHFRIRFRPTEAGPHRLALRARWARHGEWEAELPTLQVTGPAVDPFVRVDRDDPRFFSTGDGDFVWPIGINARSVNDPRGAQRVGSRFSPNRHWHSYQAYIDRWAAAGVTAAEIWMSSWNLALEWRGDWPGYAGVGHYNQINAARLDRILDYAWERGIRINLVIHNHGMASAKTDAEWPDNPYNNQLRNSSTPGTVPNAGAFFTHADALAGQERLRRYIIARWADHPAVLGWKLWTEINLTGGSREDLRLWHERASARWHALDPYQHPVTTHWSGNYRTPDRAIVAQRDINYVCIDAYHGRGDGRRGTLFADLTWDGLHHQWHGLAQFNKPIVITEYGGNWNACPEPQLIAEHRSGPWAALVSGYAASPMLWWLEWVDQGSRYQPYGALSRFIAGEDLRSRPGSQARAVTLSATLPPPPPAPEQTDGPVVPRSLLPPVEQALWCRAWARPGRALGYVMDPRWGYDGAEHPPLSGATVTIGRNVAAGDMHVEWWHAESGEIIAASDFTHPGGTLALTPPDFERHIAFKLLRSDD